MKDTKDTNPKDAIGVTKVPMHLIPGSAKAYLAMAFLEGALKYGKYNWRAAGVRSSIYLDAIERHLEKFTNGDWNDPTTRVPHLASVMACCAIILDAEHLGKLTDDRPPMGDMEDLLETLTGDVADLKELFKDFNPHQYTIEEPRCPPESQATPTTKSTTELPRPRSSEQPETRLGERPRQMELFPRETEKKSTTNVPYLTADQTQKVTGELSVEKLIDPTSGTLTTDPYDPLDDCHECHTCLQHKTNMHGMKFSMHHMIVCVDCGHKRCPKAFNHNRKCCAPFD